VPKVQRWRGRIGAIISALEQTEAAVLDRGDVEELFKGPTAASTPADGTRRATEEAGESRVDRVRPLKGFQRERDEDERSRQVRNALRQAEHERWARNLQHRSCGVALYSRPVYCRLAGA
jgi:hypothetical protein